MKPMGIFFTILIAGTVVAGGIYIWPTIRQAIELRKGPSNDDVAKLPKLDAPTEEQTKASEAEMAALKEKALAQSKTGTDQTYSSTNNNLSFHYPGDWQTVEKKIDANTFQIKLDAAANISKHDDTDLPFPLDIWIYDNLQQMIDAGINPDDKQFTTLDAYAKYYQAHTNNSSTLGAPITSTTLSGFPAYKTVALGMGSYRMTMAEINNKFYLVQATELDNEAVDKIVQGIINSITITNEFANWQSFSSKYFTLSFKIPPDFEVRESSNNLLISRKPFERFTLAEDTAFLYLTRYGTTYSKEGQKNSYKDHLRDVNESDMTIDGSVFIKLIGFDEPADSSLYHFGKEIIVLLDKSWIEIVDRPNNKDADTKLYAGNSPTDLGSKILSTMKFIK
jgi:hypothetical protein